MPAVERLKQRNTMTGMSERNMRPTKEPNTIAKLYFQQATHLRFHLQNIKGHSTY